MKQINIQNIIEKSGIDKDKQGNYFMLGNIPDNITDTKIVEICNTLKRYDKIERHFRAHGIILLVMN